MAINQTAIRIFDPTSSTFVTVLASGAMKVDGSAVTQPVSGSVSVSNFPATQPVSGTVAVSSLPAIPTGTNAIGSVSVSNFPASQAVTGTFFQATQPVSLASSPLPTGASTETTLAAVSGKLPGTLGQKTMSASLAVVIASDQAAIPVTVAASATGTITSTAGSTSSVTALAANASRKGAILNNDSTAVVRIALAATAATASYSYKLYPDGVMELPINYTGIITAIWEAAAGNMRVTELT